MDVFLQTLNIMITGMFGIFTAISIVYIMIRMMLSFSQR